MTKWCHWRSSAGDQPCLLESAYALLGSIAFRYSTCLSVWAWPGIIFSNKQGYGLVPQPGLEKHSHQGHNTKLLICGPKLGRSVSCYSPWSDCVNSWLYRGAKPIIGSTSRALQKGTQSAWIWTLIGTSPSHFTTIRLPMAKPLRFISIWSPLDELGVGTPTMLG